MPFGEPKTVSAQLAKAKRLAEEDRRAGEAAVLRLETQVMSVASQRQEG